MNRKNLKSFKNPDNWKNLREQKRLEYPGYTIYFEEQGDVNTVRATKAWRPPDVPEQREAPDDSGAFAARDCGPHDLKENSSNSFEQDGIEGSGPNGFEQDGIEGNSSDGLERAFKKAK